MEKLPLSIFKTIVEHTPLVSIDLIVEREGRYLLGERLNKPAKGFLFVPGGRIFKNEKIKDAFKRITREELNEEFHISQANFMGVYEHFYKDSFVGNNISTHYVVIAFKIQVKFDLNLPLEQHKNYFWLSKKEILKSNTVHPYTKLYFRDKS